MKPNAEQRLLIAVLGLGEALLTAAAAGSRSDDGKMPFDP